MVSQFKGKKFPKALIVVKKQKKGKQFQKVSKPLKNAITRIVKGTQETKLAMDYQSPELYNGQITTKTGDWKYPLPNIPMVGNGGVLGNATNRIGDTIQPTSFKVYNTISLSDLTELTADIYVNFFVFTLKSAKSLPVVQDSSSPGPGSFLDTGNGTSGAWLGNTTDLGLPINHREFTLIAVRRFRLSKGTGHINEGTYSDATITGASQTFKHFIINIPCPKSLKYSADLDEQPQNFCPVMAVGYTHMDGTTADSVTQNLRWCWRSCLYYKDS